MAYALRSPNGTGGGGNTNTAASGDIAVTKPSAVADGDLLVCVIYAESDANTVDVVPSGWTLAASIANTGAFIVFVYWKIASSEPASWTWSMTTGSSWYSYAVAAFTGATGSGNFVDIAGAGSQGDGQIEGNQTAGGVTTTASGDLLVFAYGNFAGSNPTGMNASGAAKTLAVAFGGTTIGYSVLGASGATGTSNPTGMGTEDYAAVHVAFLEIGAGGGGGGGAALLSVNLARVRSPRPAAFKPGISL